MTMANEAKLHSPIHSTFEALVVRHTARHCLEKEFGHLKREVIAPGGEKNCMDKDPVVNSIIVFSRK